ncbi:NADH-quinone oxidoreductase subunit NuoE [Thermosediminibacter oceani]|uniref:NADH dehydrogenase subunit E n=1 Tax=Thermosediminibacter oceani (strain ATCC BAA-1034 / DSM 16646 / JW/IW-1228P) TaxID=555079 RepID=D9S099_THEOJ|nr:NADH-quinone oxidoreductase subunit NuoE [Thermosediminibacter oceani]ADL07027.1 NADH dehydrogenase subunit E [Thermosediminibacter oceani DSM 16646]
MFCCAGEEHGIEKKFPDDEVDLSALEQVLKEYRGVPGSLITVLQKVQDIYGYLPRKALYHIAREIGVKPAKVFGVATFYAQFRLKPIGKHLIMVCHGTACHVNGAELITSALCDELKIKDGETTADGLFTLQNVACLGCCSLAPVMMIDGEAYGKLTPDKARDVIRDIYKRETGK